MNGILGESCLRASERREVEVLFVVVLFVAVVVVVVVVAGEE